MPTLDIRELIDIYVNILKTYVPYTGKEITALSEELGFKFSEATLVKSYRKKGESNGFYEVAPGTLQGIKNVLEKILKYEEQRNSEVKSKLEEYKIDLTHTPLISPRKDYPAEGNILISWDLSLQYEENAEVVYGITPTLNWARVHIDEQIQRSIEHGDRYCYILTEQRGITNKIIIEKKVQEAGVQDKIQIKELYRLPEFSNYYGITIPIPYDVAIYKNTYYPGHKTEKKTFAVTSVVVVNPLNLNFAEPDHQDVIIDKQRSEELLHWAEATWEKLK